MNAAPLGGLSLEFVAEPALAVDLAGTVLVANAAARKRLGQDAQGASLFAMVTDPPDRMRATLTRAAASTSPIMGSITLPHGPNDGRQPIRVARMSSDRGAPPIVVVVLTDAAQAQFRALRAHVDRLTALLRERQAEKAELEASLEHNRVLYSELQHRMKNNIHLIGVLMRITARDYNSDEVRAFLDAGLARIKALAWTQDAIYEARGAARLPAGPFLERVVGGVAGGLMAGGRVAVEAGGAVLAGDAAHNIALIVNELVTNALKYGRPGNDAQVRVALIPKGDGVILSVADNGSGFDPAGLAPGTGHGTGLRLVEALAMQLDGSMTVGSSPDGTRIEVVLPRSVCSSEPCRPT